MSTVQNSTNSNINLISQISQTKQNERAINDISQQNRQQQKVETDKVTIQNKTNNSSDIYKIESKAKQENYVKQQEQITANQKTQDVKSEDKRIERNKENYNNSITQKGQKVNVFA